MRGDGGLAAGLWITQPGQTFPVWPGRRTAWPLIVCCMEMTQVLQTIKSSNSEADLEDIIEASTNRLRELRHRTDTFNELARKLVQNTTQATVPPEMSQHLRDK